MNRKVGFLVGVAYVLIVLVALIPFWQYVVSCYFAGGVI